MSLIEQVEKDIIIAMKGKDTVKVSTLRMLKSALGNYLIQTKKAKAACGYKTVRNSANFGSCRQTFAYLPKFACLPKGDHARFDSSRRYPYDRDVVYNIGS